jgi:DNA-binding NtrC family response regulator
VTLSVWQDALRKGMDIEAVKRALVLAALEICKGNKTHAAKLLGISVRGMRDLCARYGVTKG